MYNFDPLEESRPECWECHKKENALDEAAELVAAIQEALYTTDFPDMKLFKEAFDGLRACLGVPALGITGEPVPRGMDNFLAEWMQDSKNHFKTLLNY